MSTLPDTAASRKVSTTSDSQRLLEQRHRERLEVCLFEFENRAIVAEQKLAVCQEHLGRVHLEYVQIHDSSSWRLTSPLRNAVAWVRRSVITRKILTSMVVISKRVASRHPKLRPGMLNFLARFPSIESGARKLTQRAEKSWSAQNSNYAESINSLDRLSGSTRQIYSELKAELAAQNRS